MLLLLLDFLSGYLHYKVPSVFFYYSTRMLLGALTSLFFVLFFSPWFIQKLYELKVGQSLRVQDCPTLSKLHEKKKETPTMGGIIILCALATSLLLWMDLTCIFTWILFLTLLWLGIVGGVDDYLKLKWKNAKGLKGRWKLLLQLMLGGLLASYLLFPSVQQFISHRLHVSPPVVKAGNEHLSASFVFLRYYIPFMKTPIVFFSLPWIVFSFGIILFVVCGSSNAVNLTDGLDGLASGCIVFVSLVLAIVAFLSNHVQIAKYLNILYIENSGEIAVFLFAVFGACLAFLWYNGFPAQMFMGDVGSISLGGLLGVSAILLRREGLLALVGGIFVIEALSVIIQVLSYRYRNRKRIFLCAPLHHHFEYKGWPETKVVIRFWIVGIILALIGLISIKFQ